MARREQHTQTGTHPLSRHIGAPPRGHADGPLETVALCRAQEGEVERAGVPVQQISGPEIDEIPVVDESRPDCLHRRHRYPVKRRPQSSHARVASA